MIYVILVHRDPVFLKRLLDRLTNDINAFVIHVDSRVDIEPFLQATTGMTNCFFTSKRFASKWGSFGLVEATLHAFDFIRVKITRRMRIIVLSGSDYPIKSRLYIENYLDFHPNTIFLEYSKVPTDTWHQGGINRFPLYNQLNDTLDFYGGSQWFSIPYNTMLFILSFLKENLYFIRYFKLVKIPDESFFHTLLLNCEDPKVLNNIVNMNLHLIKWDENNFGPRVFRLKDFDEIQKSDRLFARKFFDETSNELLDKIDREILDKNVHL